MAQISGGNVVSGAASGTLGPFAFAGTPVSGAVGTGTLAGVAAKGSLLVDTTNAVLYQNTNTQASPTWSKVGLQA